MAIYYSRGSNGFSNSSRINGGVFITDIAPMSLGNVGSKLRSSDGEVLDSCVTDTPDVIVSVMALSGDSCYKPTITVGGINVSNLTEGADAGTWFGSTTITLNGTGYITATHCDGPQHTCYVSIQAGPNIISAEFIGGYPGTQTELKENDTFNLRVQSDKPMTGIQVYDFEAGKPQTYTFSSTQDYTVTITIANRGNLAVLRPVKVKCHDVAGSWGSDYTTNSTGSVDGTNVVNCNNLHPTVSIVSISYPGSQQALKDSETASINHTVSDYNSIVYSSPNSDLGIPNTSSYESPKIVTRIAGNYNISIVNFRIVANRQANASSTTVDRIVNIAHVSPTVTVTEPAVRLRSGGNSGTSAQNHIITITSNQNLLSAPTLVAPEGTWSGPGFIGGPLVWTRQLQIHDDDVKATYTWGAMSTINLAGKEVTIISGDSHYTIGGFVIRTLTIPAWVNREVSIGTAVSNATKLRCTNLSKGASGSLNFTYKSDTSNALDRFTVTDPSGVANPIGNLFYNCDLANASSNTTGSMRIELEEIV
jgi:hypothetical protein